MSIISKETWEKLIPEEEKKNIKAMYKAMLDIQNTENDIESRTQIITYEDLFSKENLQPKQKEYWEIEEELFNHRANQWLSYYIIDWDKPHSTPTQIVKSDCTSRKQAEKLLAINKLLNVAAYLNKNEDGTPWKPNWENPNEEKWGIDLTDGEITTTLTRTYQTSIVYFRTKELAEQAIQILGEDIIRIALKTDY